MSMFWLEQQLRQSGDPVDQERANLVASMLMSRGEDIPLPGVGEVPGESNAEDRAEVAPSAGFLVLREPRNDFLHKTVEDFDIEAEHREELAAMLRQVTLPYEDLASRLTPPFAQKKLRNGSKSWNIANPSRGIQSSMVSLSWESRNKTNTPRELMVRHHTLDGSAIINYNFSDGEIKAINVNTNKGAVLENVFCQTRLGEALKKLRRNEAGKILELSYFNLRFRLDHPEKLNIRSTICRPQGYGDFFTELDATFSPASAELPLEFNGASINYIPATKDMKSLGKGEYVALIKDVLESIPAIRAEY